MKYDFDKIKEENKIAMETIPVYDDEQIAEIIKRRRKKMWIMLAILLVILIGILAYGYGKIKNDPYSKENINKQNISQTAQSVDSGKVEFSKGQLSEKNMKMNGRILFLI